GTKVTHTKVNYHGASNFSGPLNVAAGASGKLIKNDHLGSTTTQEHRNFVYQLRLSGLHLVFFGWSERETKRPAPRHNRNAVYGIGVWRNVCHNSMPSFVVRCHLALVVVLQALFTGAQFNL